MKNERVLQIGVKTKGSRCETEIWKTILWQDIAITVH